MFRLVTVIFVSVATLSGGVALACQGPRIPSNAYEAINLNRINQALFSRVIVEWTNYYRCKAGQQPVRRVDSLTRAASTHSKNMARYQILSHETPARGAQTIKKRVNKASRRSKRYSENISQYFAYQTGRSRFLIKDMSQCYFTQGGERVSVHTYASLGEITVNDWINSPAHRRNSLNGYYNKSGAGVGVAFTDQRPCGLFYVSQTLAN
ncbi:MAG: CAP domain-containing protein [Pseudomonadota bacterium]